MVDPNDRRLRRYPFLAQDFVNLMKGGGDFRIEQSLPNDATVRGFFFDDDTGSIVLHIHSLEFEPVDEHGVIPAVSFAKGPVVGMIREDNPEPEQNGRRILLQEE